MTLYHLHCDGWHRAGGDRLSLIVRIVRNRRAATSALLRSIAALTVGHLERARTCQDDDGEERSPQHDLIRYPQAPLILGDKWDF
jgi:hypothetical protein